jgi:hypothetical protein
MKRKALRGLLAAFFICVCLPSLSAETIDDFVKQYVDRFDSDGTGTVSEDVEFCSNVPRDERCEVLARILDTLSSRNLIDEHTENDIWGACGAASLLPEWTPHLKNSLRALTVSKNAGVRKSGVNQIAKRPKDEAKELILSFQNDPDDGVRSIVLNDIRLWPDAALVYRKYLTAHQGNPAYKQSLQTATDCLAINQYMLAHPNH